MPVKANINQMFVLIEGILPFEACLYYQVLPLSIEGSCLNLGMVNPNDQAAADYVRRLVSYINCSIVPREIPSDWHREVLSKFLSHSAKNRPAASTSSGPTPSPAANPPPQASDTHPDSQLSPSKSVASPTPSPVSSRAASNTPSASPSVSQQPTRPKPSAQSPFAEQPTLVVNAPDTLGEATPSEPAATKVAQPDSTKSVPEGSQETPSPSPSKTAGFATTANALPSLQHLPPRDLTDALLDRVIDEGIGRLYLERQPQTGRVLWSKDGVLQSVLEQVDLQVFQGVINELKLMVNLSLIPTRKPRQVEIERSHRGKRILLRFRLIPGNHGEEATLQVLRGAALKFYQQQQIEKMGRDALGVAQTLQNRLDDIRQQARQNLPSDPVPNETLPAIVEMLKNMEQQVHEMLKSPDT